MTNHFAPRHLASHRTLAFAAGLALLGGAAIAQDDGLYPEPSAPDASFLRVLAPEGGAVAIDGRTLEADENGMTAYVEIGPGPVTLSVGGAEATIEAGPNLHYSYVLDDDEGTLMTDGVTGSPAQADLVFYNLSDIAKVDVFVPSADALALEEVAADASAAVALRAPLILDLELRDGETPIGEVAGVELVRSAATSVVLSGSAGNYVAVSGINTYAD